MTPAADLAVTAIDLVRARLRAEEGDPAALTIADRADILTAAAGDVVRLEDELLPARERLARVAALAAGEG